VGNSQDGRAVQRQRQQLERVPRRAACWCGEPVQEDRGGDRKDAGYGHAASPAHPAGSARQCVVIHYLWTKVHLRVHLYPSTLQETKLMRKLTAALYFAVSLAGNQIVMADEQKGTGDVPKGEISQAIEVQATVTAIDQKTRMVTLKDADG